jgi:hypothetical protein
LEPRPSQPAMTAESESRTATHFILQKLIL